MEKAILFRVHREQREAWKQWCQELATNLREQALLSLQEEQVLQELTLGFELSGEYFVIGFMDGENLPANMTRALNQQHQAMKAQCLERIGPSEVLYNIKL